MYTETPLSRANKYCITAMTILCAVINVHFTGRKSALSWRFFLISSWIQPVIQVTAEPRWRTAGRAPRCENNSSPDGRYAVVNPLTHRSKPNKRRRGAASRSGAAKFYPRASPFFFIIQPERGRPYPRKQRTIVKPAAKVLQIKRSCAAAVFLAYVPRGK